MSLFRSRIRPRLRNYAHSSNRTILGLRREVKLSKPHTPGMAQSSEWRQVKADQTIISSPRVF